MSTDEPRDPTEQETEGRAFDASDPACWEEALGGQSQSSWLIRDPAVLATIQSGRTQAMYDIFRKKLSAAPSARAKEALEKVLGNRRYFLDASDAPGMRTINGIGTRVYGSHDRNPQDGTYITTLFFTLLFLPLWPIRQYLVAKADGDGWYFLGRVPTSPLYRWWRRVVGVGLVALLAGIAVSVWQSETQSEVHFLNGLDVPVSIRMGENTLQVQPGGRETRTYGSGEYAITATHADGRVLEEREESVPGGVDLAVYNVLGAAALLHEAVPCTANAKDKSLADSRYRARSLAGASWVTREDVDFVFVEAPRTARMGKSDTVVTRTRVSVVTGGWRAAVSMLGQEGKMAEAAGLARRVAELSPRDLDAAQLAFSYLEQHGDDEATLAFVEGVVAASPKEINAHRLYQMHMQHRQEEDTIIPTYRAEYEANPDSPDHAYLYARLLPFDDELPILEPLVALHPDHAWIRRALSWVHFHEGRFEKALPHYEALERLAPEEKGGLLPYMARALVGVGRPEEALALVSKFLDGAPARLGGDQDALAGGDPWTLMILYARLQRLVPAAQRGLDVPKRWQQLGQATPDVTTIAGTAARARDAALVDSVRPRLRDREIVRYCDLSLLSRTRVEEAAKLALDVSPELLAQLDDVAQTSIACELDRRGHSKRALEVLGGLSPEATERLKPEDLVALPEVGNLSEDLSPDLRAAMLYAASRRVEDPKLKRALLEKASRLDTLRLVLPDDARVGD